MKKGNRHRKDNSRPANGERIASERLSSGGIIFGVQPVIELLRAETRNIERVYIARSRRSAKTEEITRLAKAARVRFDIVNSDDIVRLAGHGVNHQGVIAVSSGATYYDAVKLFDEVTGKKGALIVILDGIEDPRNFGAILRTAECAGVDGVFIPERRSVGLTEVAAKASAGASEYVKVAKVKNINRLIDELKKNNVWVLGTSGKGNSDYMDWDWKQSTALVLGNEGKGLHRLTSEKCDELVRIPLKGRIDSLNVSVAAGVVLYEALRQRMEKS